MEADQLAIVVLTAFGWFVLVVNLTSTKRSSLRRIAALLPMSPNQNRVRREITSPYSGVSEQTLDGIASRLINVLEVLASIYGILFALIISEKASLIFTTWTFLIWCGWVLAILIRICYCCAILLTDYYQWERPKKELMLHGMSKFAKHSGYLLVLTGSFVPIFATLNVTSLDNIIKTYPWGQQESLFLGIFAFALTTVSIYGFIFAFKLLMRLEFVDIYTLGVVLLWGLGLGLIGSSPLDPYTNRLLTFGATLPSAVFAIQFVFMLLGAAFTSDTISATLINLSVKVGRKLKSHSKGDNP